MTNRQDVKGRREGEGKEIDPQMTRIENERDHLSIFRSCASSVGSLPTNPPSWPVGPMDAAASGLHFPSRARRRPGITVSDRRSPKMAGRTSSWALPSGTSTRCPSAREGPESSGRSPWAAGSASPCWPTSTATIRPRSSWAPKTAASIVCGGAVRPASEADPARVRGPRALRVQRPPGRSRSGRRPPRA